MKTNKKEAEEKENIQEALEALFFCDFIIDLRDYSFRICKAQPYMMDLLENCENAIDAAESYVEYMVAEESKEEMRAFLDMTTLVQRLKTISVLDHVYHDPNIGWSKAIFTVIDRNKAGDAETVALVVEAISTEKELSILDAQSKQFLEMEAGLWHSLQRMMHAGNTNAKTSSLVQEVLDYYWADRAYIFEFDWEKKTASNTFEACKTGVEPMIEELQEVPVDAFDVWIRQFQEKSVFQIKNLDDLAGDETRKEEYDILAPQGIHSLLSAPVYYEGELVGFLGVDNPRDNLEDTAFITSLAFFCVNVSLKERKIETLETKSMKDSLTGAYNRQGYDEILHRHQDDRRPMAYVLLDIDYFQKLNDSYGHVFGDEALRQVVTQLKRAFRAEDYVFRFGGDEFALLLTNCHPNDWKSISDKQRMIHVRLNQILKKDMYVTLSMGITWSESGITKEMIELADTALYQAKNNGRSGCCVLGNQHQIIYEWKDEIGIDSKGTPLEESQTGACRIELPEGDLTKGRLMCNDTARVLMGFDASMTPEECFRTWLNRMDAASRVAIQKTRKALMEKGKAECTYLYDHPLKGPIRVRSGGRCEINRDGIVFYGYHQSLADTEIISEER